jgi:uroporphyrinogen-III synthase/uroporphyrinogen III methyltransferase/synthase
VEPPLKGRLVLVTRAAHQAGKLSDGLRALGAEVVEVPVLEIRPPADFGPLDLAIYQLAAYDWLIFTSANTVRAVADRARELGVALVADHAKVAAVGGATEAALSKAGLQVHFIPESYVAESLVEGFPGEVRGKRVLLARAAIARDVVPDALRGRGAHIDVVDAYRNVMPEDAPVQLVRALQEPVDAATFTSSSTVKHLAQAAREAGIVFPLTGVKAVSIGPVTSETLREFGWTPEAEAEPHDLAGLVGAVEKALGRVAST